MALRWVFTLTLRRGVHTPWQGALWPQRRQLACAGNSKNGAPQKLSKCSKGTLGHYWKAAVHVGTIARCLQSSRSKYQIRHVSEDTGSHPVASGEWGAPKAAAGERGEPKAAAPTIALT